MKAHFIASAVDLKPDIIIYRKIVSILKKYDVTLTSDWLDDAYRRTTDVSGNEAHATSWKKIYRENLEAISRADIVVAEISKKSFLVGFQVANALQLKKPILLLSSHERVESAIGVSLNEEIIKFVVYTPRNLEDKIIEFINENSIKAKDLRFNFFIDRKILNYLNWASFSTGDTKSEIIRRVLMREIERSEFDE